MNPDESSCFHCGLPVPAGSRYPVRYEGNEQPTCCAGCQAVAQGIIDAGLGSYYKHRTAEAERAVLPPPEVLAQLKLYDLPEVQAEFVEIQPDNRREAVLMLGGVTCAACVWLIEQKLMRLAGVERAELNYSTQRARVCWDESRVRLSDILLAVRETGYSAAPYDAQKHEAQTQRERKKMLIRLAVAALSSMQTMMFALPTYLYADIEPQYLLLLHWGAFFMVLPAMFYSATPFYRGAWRDFKNGRTGMDTPVAIAIVMTFIAGIYALLSNAGQGMYFESIAMFVFFLLLGRFMEQSARRKAGDAAERLVKLVPAFCHLLPAYPDPKSEEAAVASLKAGDVLLVRGGETIPADGVVLEGESEINEAMLTGENLPVPKFSGCRVTAGTLNTAGPLTIRVEQTGSATRLAHIVRLLDRALSQKPRLAEQAERYAATFTRSLIITAVPTFIGWWWFADAGTALWITVSLLVVTCPCALSLATPAALAAATGNLASRGILVARGHALETLAAVDTVVFDKTGTLTHGRLQVVRTLALTGNPYADAAAQALEEHSEHPAARAIAALPVAGSLKNAVAARNRVSRVGHGVCALLTIAGREQNWALGRPEFVAETAGSIPPELAELEQQGSVIALGNADGFQAAYLLADENKVGFDTVIAQLQNRGLAVHILSGDRRAAVAALAQTLGISDIRAEATPEDKLAYVQTLQRQGRRVLMLGDGINDAPVLAAADISVAVAGSADVARDGADILLLNDDPTALPHLFALAARTRAVIRQNLIWASVYNLIAVPLALAGFVTPWLAALGMSFSSLLVVWNALRLRR